MGLDDETAHPAMPEIMRVRTADTDRGHVDQHITGPPPRYGPLLHFDRSGSTNAAARILVSGRSVVYVALSTLTC